MRNQVLHIVAALGVVLCPASAVSAQDWYSDSPAERVPAATSLSTPTAEPLIPQSAIPSPEAGPMTGPTSHEEPIPIIDVGGSGPTLDDDFLFLDENTLLRRFTEPDAVLADDDFAALRQAIWTGSWSANEIEQLRMVTTRYDASQRLRLALVIVGAVPETVTHAQRDAIRALRVFLARSLIALLGADAFEDRDNAHRALLGFGMDTLYLVAAAEGSRDFEISRRSTLIRTSVAQAEGAGLAFRIFNGTTREQEAATSDLENYLLSRRDELAESVSFASQVLSTFSLEITNLVGRAIAELRGENYQRARTFIAQSGWMAQRIDWLIATRNTNGLNIFNAILLSFREYIHNDAELNDVRTLWQPIIRAINSNSEDGR